MEIERPSEAAGDPGAPAGRAPVAARAVLRRILLQTALLVLAGAFVTFACVLTLAQGGASRADAPIALAVLVVTITHFAAALALHGGSFRRVLAVDAARREAQGAPPRPAPPRPVVEAALAAVANAPRDRFVRALAWFVAGGVNVALTRHVLMPEAFPLGQVAVRSVGSLSGAFLVASVLFFLLKRGFAPLREQLVRDLGDPAAARALVTPVPLRLKLVVGVSGALAVATLYGAVLGHVRATGTAEASAVHVARGLLDDVASGTPVETVDARARRLGLAGSVHVVDPHSAGGLAALAGPLAGFEVEAIRRAGLAGGDSRDVASPHHFAWRSLADGRLVVVVSPASLYGSHVPGMVGALGAFLVVVLLVTGAVTWLLATDTQRTLHAIGAEVERLASGDLRPGRPFLWEDELGVLAGRLGHMADRLRDMVGRVSGTADRVEAAAGGIAHASRSLVSTGREQVEGMDAMRASLSAVTAQVDGIAGSAQRLSQSVEEGSSSILELRGAGQSLDGSAAFLTGKVDEVSSALSELVRSVRDVMEHAEQLSGAAVDTSSSMEQMAASLREVDTNASETARLSQSAAEAAEGGRAKVYETLEDMQGIQETTRSARRVIHDLGSRTREIGAIVNVIDDVAEETNLLALNAAIIAAQAGENGRAFGVVADEIKKLADRVLASTKEIERVILSVQQESHNAVGAIEEGTRVVGRGVKRAQEAGEALDVITGSVGDAGRRIAEIVAAVGEQTRAAGHVVALMERVRSGVEHIRRAGREQDRGNEAILTSAEAMREIARQVRRTTAEQAEGSGRLAEGVEAVRQAAGSIDGALSEQGEACRVVEAELGRVGERVRAHGAVAEDLDAAVGRMREEAQELRDQVRRFRT